METRKQTSSAFDSIAFQAFLKKASVDFGKSNTQKDSCKVYFINGFWADKPISITVENCEKTVEVLLLDYRSQ
jgi:hypothetical protein